MAIYYHQLPSSETKHGSVFLSSLNPKGHIHIVANQGREEMQNQKRSSQETTVQPWIQIPPQGIHTIIFLSIFSSFVGIKAPHTHVEDGNFRLSARFLEHCSGVRECLTGGFLHAVSQGFSVPYQFLFQERVELHSGLRS